MRAFVAAIIVALFGALAIGTQAASRPVPPRDAFRPVAADSTWYASLPPDPAAATAAFLQRVPADARTRGDAFGATRYVTLPLRIAVLVGSVLLLLFSGAAVRMRGFAERLTKARPAQDAVVSLLMFAALFALSLPVESYAGYARFRAAGFSGASYWQWLTDTTMAWATITPFYVVGIVAIMALIRARPRSWMAWASGVYLVVSASYVLVAPVLIEPLFNELTPLAEGPQKEAILALAREHGVPAADVFVRDASRQGTLLDAHVSGFAGSARIVLDDNTIATATDAEVRMVMAHEIGHYVLGHIPKGILFDAAIMALGIVLVGWSAGRFLARYGTRLGISRVGDVAALPLLWGSFLLWGFVAIPATNGVSRYQERQADRFGLDASHEPIALAEYMIRDADTGQLDPAALEEWIFYGHPSPRRRIEMAMRWRAEQGETRSSDPAR